jgi:hypothetical protein
VAWKLDISIRLWSYVSVLNNTESLIFKGFDDEPLHANQDPLLSEEIVMSEEDTYVRAKLTEINGAIERLTQMLNRMIDVISGITEVQDSTSELTLAVNANTERLDELIKMVKELETSAPVAASGAAVADKGAVSSLQSVLDTLETQVREGVIASDLAQRINESAGILEGKGVAGSLVVKMQRWTRILRTYGRIDTISPSDLAKLRTDIKEWSKELAKMR